MVAAMALVIDLGRMVNYQDESGYVQACVRNLMEVTLFGSPEDPEPRPPRARGRRGSSSPSRVAPVT
jgi:hypothetical protein